MGVMCFTYAGDPFFCTMFPDTEIAKKYGSGCTKTNVLVETLVIDDSNFIASQMQYQPFSVATDGSNDMDNRKLYPVTVRYVYLLNFLYE